MYYYRPFICRLCRGDRNLYTCLLRMSACVRQFEPIYCSYVNDIESIKFFRTQMNVEGCSTCSRLDRAHTIENVNSASERARRGAEIMIRLSSSFL